MGRAFSNGKLASQHAMLSGKVNAFQLQIVLQLLLPLVSLYAAEVQLNTKDHLPNEGARRELVCPPPNYRPPTPETLLLNLLPCARSKDCPLYKELGILCCKTYNKGNNRCRYGVIPPKPKPTHLPILGLERHCPEKEPLAEFLPVKNCSSDNDCWPRICCDGYCRTPAITKMQLSNNGSTTLASLRYAAEYLQCTPPPRYDFFRKPCLSMRDCFPLVCCQENDMKVCRPAKRSILPLIATFVKDATEGQ